MQNSYLRDNPDRLGVSRKGCERNNMTHARVNPFVAKRGEYVTTKKDDHCSIDRAATARLGGAGLGGAGIIGGDQDAFICSYVVS